MTWSPTANSLPASQRKAGPSRRPAARSRERAASLRWSTSARPRGDHHRLVEAVAGASRPPVADQLVDCRFERGGEGDAPVVAIDRHRFVHVAVAELVEGGSLPGAGLAAVDAQLDRVPGGESGEGAACFDLGQLAGVAD